MMTTTEGRDKLIAGSASAPAVLVEKPRLSHLFRVIGTVSLPRGAIVLGLLISLVEIAATLLSPLITRNIIDGLRPGPLQATAIISDPNVRLLLLALIGGAIASATSTYLLAKAGLIIAARLKSHLTKTLLCQRVAYFDARQSGEHVSRVTGDAGTISNLLTRDLQGLLVGVILLIGSAIVLALLDIRLTAAIFGIVAVAFLVMAPIVARMALITRGINDGNAKLGATLARTFAEIRLVKAYSAEAVEQHRSDLAIGEVYATNLRSVSVQAALTPIISMALTFAMLAIFIYGGGRVARGTLTIGTLTAFILYIFNIVAPLLSLTSFFSTLNAAKGASQRIHEILEQPAEVETSNGDRRNDEPLPLADLTFSNVELTYPGAASPAIKLDNLVVPGGSRTAIIGPSGAGKTSLISLLERFYEPTSGAISWGGADIRQIPLERWRGSIGYVAQGAPLMAGTIRENIEYGQRPAGDERLIRAAEAANCMSFISQLEAGLDADVGESGSKLSGGQRQRIAIARVFMRDPKLLLLDEATSHLDVEGEDLVLNALKRLMVGRTTLIITHRLSSLSNVDYVGIVEGGQLADFGRRDEIVAYSAYYRRISGILSA